MENDDYFKEQLKKLETSENDFYRKKKHFFYKEDFECAKTKEKKEKAIKCNYFLDVFDKMLLLNSDESITCLNHSNIKEHLKQFENFDIYQKKTRILMKMNN